MSSPLTAIGGLVTGFALPFQGARLLFAERRLWGPAFVPFALSALAVSGALALVATNAGDLHAWLTAWMPDLEVSHWVAWLWVGPTRLMLTLLGGLLMLLLVVLCMVAAYLLANLLAAPFHDVLSQRVEQILTGDVVDAAAPGLAGVLREAARSLVEEGRRTIFFIVLVGGLLGFGFVIPGAHLLTAPLVLILTLLFLPLDYASYALDRRAYSFRDKRRWISENLSLMLGFGSAAFVTCVVPLLNFAAMPLLVVGGTLLTLRLESPTISEESGARGVDSGTPGGPTAAGSPSRRS